MRTTMSTMSQDSGSVYLPPRRGDEPPWFVGRIQQKVKDYVNAPTATQAEKEIAKLRRECSIYEGIRDRSAQVKDAVGTLYKAKEYFKDTENRAENIKVDSRLAQLQKDLQILQSTNPDIKKAEDDYFVGQYAIPAMAAQKRENRLREAILPGRSSIPAPLPAARERDLRPAKLLMQVREKNLSLEKMSTPTVTRPPTDQEIIKAEGLENTPFEEQANTIQGYRKQGITITVVDEKETKRQIGTDPDPYNKSNPSNPNYSPKYDLTRNAPADFPKNLNIDSLVDYCKYLGLDHTFAGRKKLAERYGIENYTGSPTQNIKLLAILKEETQRQKEPEPETPKTPEAMEDSDLNTKISQMGDKDQIIIAWLRVMKDRATASGEYLYLQYLDMAIRRMNDAGEYSENFETADDYLKRLGDVFWQQIENEQKGTAFQNSAMTFMWGKYTNWGQGYPKNISEPEFKGFKIEGAGSKMNPNEIRFSQSSVNGADEITTSMKANGWQGDPIDVVKMPDGKFSTLDNTRVVSARQAEIDVQANIHAYNEPLPSNLVQRFTTPRGVPKTWGEALELRIGKQNATFRNTYPSGSFEMPKTNN